MSVDTVTSIPMPPDTSREEMARWYADNIHLVNRMWAAIASFRDYVKAAGAVRAGDVLISPKSAGYAYDGRAIAAELPALVDHIDVTVTVWPKGDEDAVTRAARVCELLDEGMPGTPVACDYDVDKAAVKAAIRNPDVHARIAQHIRPKTSGVEVHRSASS